MKLNTKNSINWQMRVHCLVFQMHIELKNHSVIHESKLVLNNIVTSRDLLTCRGCLLANRGVDSDGYATYSIDRYSK